MDDEEAGVAAALCDGETVGEGTDTDATLGRGAGCSVDVAEMEAIGAEGTGSVEEEAVAIRQCEKV